MTPSKRTIKQLISAYNSNNAIHKLLDLKLNLEFPLSVKCNVIGNGWYFGRPSHQHVKPYIVREIAVVIEDE